MRDYRSEVDMVEDVPTTLTEQQKMAACRVICANAQGDSLEEQRADAELLMAVLGVHPTLQVDEGYHAGVNMPLSNLVGARGVRL